MAEIDDATEMMKSAWAIRRLSFSASGREREALINEAHQKLVDAVAIYRNAGARPQLAQAIHMLANVRADLFERARVQGTNRGILERYRAGRCSVSTSTA